jgi:hypothetical protein
MLLSFSTSLFLYRRADGSGKKGAWNMSLQGLTNSMVSAAAYDTPGQLPDESLLPALLSFLTAEYVMVDACCEFWYYSGVNWMLDKRRE